MSVDDAQKMLALLKIAFLAWLLTTVIVIQFPTASIILYLCCQVPKMAWTWLVDQQKNISINSSLILSDYLEDWKWCGWWIAGSTLDYTTFASAAWPSRRAELPQYRWLTPLPYTWSSSHHESGQSFDAISWKIWWRSFDGLSESFPLIWAVVFSPIHLGNLWNDILIKHSWRWNFQLFQRRFPEI